MPLRDPQQNSWGWQSDSLPSFPSSLYRKYQRQSHHKFRKFPHYLLLLFN